MKYYTRIHVPNFRIIQEKTQAFLDSKNWRPRVGFHAVPWDEYVESCSEILTAFEMYDLKPLWAATYITYEQKHSSPHIDYRNPQLNLCRINLPIKNCTGTYTEFFTGGEYREVYQPTGEKFYIVKSDANLVKVDQVEMVGPTVMRVQEPHRVVHTLPDRQQRINLTVYTDKDPVFLLPRTEE